MTQESFENKQEKMTIAFGEKKKKTNHKKWKQNIQAPPEATTTTKMKKKRKKKITNKEKVCGTKLLRLICEFWSTQATALRNSRMSEIWCLSFLSYKTQSL